MNNADNTQAVTITLPDGSQRGFDRPVTLAGLAAAIGPDFARQAFAGKVDGRLIDAVELIDHYATV